MSECEAWSRLEGVLGKLGEEVTDDGGLLEVRDDTLLHKLHTHLHTLLLRIPGPDGGAQRAGLMQFVEAVMEPSVAANARNSASVALALKVLASLVTVDGDFKALSDSKGLCHFLVMLPTVRGDPSLASAALTLVDAIMAHTDGLLWLVKNGIWEKMLLSCLLSPSIFVQREGVTVITAFILKLADTQHFERLVKDLYLISDKFCELRCQVGHTEGEELRQTNLRVLEIFRQLYWQTLGKSAIYYKIRSIDDMNTRLLPILQYKVPQSSVTCFSDVLILNLMHKFQEKLINYGLLEQFLLDSLCAEMITLTRLLLERGYMEAFIRSSANIHKYWAVMVTNLKETHSIDLSSVEALLHIVTTFQVTCFLALYQTCLDKIMESWPEKLRVIARWNEEIHSRIKTKDDIKAEAGRLEHEMVAVLSKNLKQTVSMAITCITSITNVAEHLNPVCAVTVFQGLTFMLCSQDCTASPMRHQAALQRSVIDCLRVLVERFSIDWRKCYASVCLMGKLCDMAQISGLTPQVKVCALKAMNTCINGFIPPVMSMLMNSEQLENNSVEQLGKVLAVYLADVEWEVRDSALEVLITCMKLAKEKYPHFVDWFLRYRLNTAVITAISDIEGYVRASAFTVLANIISIDKVWAELEEENLPHRALYAALSEGEAVVRKAALALVQELFLAGKYSEDEVLCLVMSVVQHLVEDSDDEVRLAALGFVHTHIINSFSKAGMMDGEFPSMTFSKGKITKLDGKEVKSRVVTILSWICECGYLCVLLAGLRDLVSSVVDKAKEILCFLNDLITRYDIKAECSNIQRHEEAGVSRVKGRSRGEGTRVVTVVGHRVTLDDTDGRHDEMDRAINDILSSSSLETVTMIKRPPGVGFPSGVTPEKVMLTPEDVPLASSPMPLPALLQSIDSLCQPASTSEGERHQISEMISLLDDILLEGERQQSHLDDQRLRDCY